MAYHMISPYFALCFVIFIALCSVCVKADSGNSITLYPIKMEAIFSYEDTTYRSSVKSRETVWEAALKVKQIGYLLDPKIAGFNIEVEPLIRRSELDNNNSNQETDGDLLSYFAQANLLRGTPGPLGVDLSAQRSDNKVSGTLGNQFDTITDSKKVILHYKNRAFPTYLSYEKRLYEEEFRSSINSAVTKREESLQSWLISGRSSKLQVRLEHNELDDRVPARNNDYALDKANISHSYPWGRGSQLQSSIGYYDRTGFNANRRFSLNQSARIQHLDNVHSQASYHYHKTEQTIENKEQGFEYQIHHKLYNNLNSAAFVNVNNQDSDNADEDKWRIGVRSYYNKSNLFGANVSAGARVSHQKTDRVSTLGLADVVDESHVVPLGSTVTLDNRFILVATLVVSDSTGNVIYEEGVDYNVLSVSGDYTQLLIITGGRINTGDAILVSYNAQLLPTQSFTTTFRSYKLSLDFDWFRLYHSDGKSNDKQISGASESSLHNKRNTLSEIVFYLELAGLKTQLGAERRFTSNSWFESEQYTFSQLISWASSNRTSGNRIRWNLNATQSFTEQVDLETDLYRVNLTANWRPRANLTIRPTMSIWKRIDEGNAVNGYRRDDKYYAAGVSAQWRFRKIDINLNIHRDRREVMHLQNNESTGITENHIMFVLKRRLM